MLDINPAPILDYLSSVLPAPLYSLLFSILSRVSSLVATLVALFAALVSTKPWDWDAQTLLPPLITLFSAYLALLSIYRTTTWALRTGFFFVKWGALLAILAGGASWFAGDNINGGVGGGGVVEHLGSVLLDMTNGRDRNAAGSSRSRSRSRAGGRPKPWQPFEQHHQWQYQEQRREGFASVSDDVQKVIADIVDGVRESGWWRLAKGFVDGTASGQDEHSTIQRQPVKSKKAKSKSGSSKSR